MLISWYCFQYLLDLLEYGHSHWEKMSYVPAFSQKTLLCVI